MSSISTATAVRPGLNRVIAAAVAAAALAGGTLAIALSNDTPAPPVPTPAQATGRAQDLSSFDPVLLHRHGVEVPRAQSPSTGSTESQRAAAERFHHRR